MDVHLLSDVHRVSSSVHRYPPDSRVLACGPGIFGRYVHNYNCNLYAVPVITTSTCILCNYNDSSINAIVMATL